MIKTHFVLRYSDSHNQFVQVKPDGSPHRTANPSLMTFWQASEYAENYAKIWPNDRFICYEVEFNLSEVI